MNRRENLIALAERFYMNIPTEEQDSFVYSGEEDLAEVLYGGDELERWACVTQHDDYTYLYLYPTREQAEERGVEYVSDDTFSESPIAVADLDSGKLYRIVKLIPVYENDSQATEIRKEVVFDASSIEADPKQAQRRGL